METPDAKDVPSNAVPVTLASFAKGAMFMAFVPLVLFLAVWKLQIGKDFMHIVGYGTMMLALAQIMSSITTRERNPVSWVFMDNIIFILLVRFGFDVVTHRKPFPFWVFVINIMLLNMVLTNIRRIGLPMFHALSILFLHAIILILGLSALERII